MINNKVFALVDCNNFFVSCERVFNPELINKAVVVLSNNDGCVIARSNEAKKLGIEMGVPYFQIKEFCKNMNVIVLSSNYQLYGDISKRVMSVISNFTPNIEFYSIDEAFLDLTGLDSNINEYAEEIVNLVMKWTGIPVSIGIGSTKTLAKLANNFAKKYVKEGIYNLLPEENKQMVLSLMDVGSVWGIGKKCEKKLKTLGINTAFDLAKADSKYIRNNFSVVGEKISYELRGITCLELAGFEPKKNITSSRSFGIMIKEFEDLEEALANFVARAAIKLRNQNSFARGIYVFAQSRNNDKSFKFNYDSEILNFELPTNSTSKLISYAKKCIKNIYKPGAKYKKCGVILLDLIDKDSVQENLFETVINKREQILLEIMDGINTKIGKGKMTYAGLGKNKKWQEKRAFCSNHYTTSWSDLPLVS